MTDASQKPSAKEPNGASKTMANESSADDRSDNVENKPPTGAGERPSKRTSIASTETKDTKDGKDSKGKSPKKRRKVNHGMTRASAPRLFLPRVWLTHGYAQHAYIAGDR